MQLQEFYLHHDCILILSWFPSSSPVLTAEQVETVRTRLEEAGQEEVCTDTSEINPEDATMFTCVEECPDGGNFSEPAGIDNVCYGEKNDVPGSVLACALHATRSCLHVQHKVSSH